MHNTPARGVTVRPASQRRLSALVLSFLVVMPLTVAATPSATADTRSPGAQGCTDAGGLAPRVEHERLTDPAVADILDRSGFDDVAPGVRAALTAARNGNAALTAARTAGTELWERAAGRAQGRGDAGGDLPRTDDRPLYWARLAAEAEIIAATPQGFTWSDRGRCRALAAFGDASRGIDTVSYDDGSEPGSRVLVSGFDPFQLDGNIRQSNPSGAVALAMDGRTITTPDGPVTVEAVMLPVLWDPFADGVVERAFTPHLRSGTVHTAITISQGRPDRFDLEYWNGANRGGFADNDRIGRTGLAPIPAWAPHTTPQPQWTRTTLPTAAMLAADTGDYPVIENHVVTEIPAGGTEPVTREDPTPGSTAVSGAGGDYLSNESAYRATALRDALDLDTRQGHIHVPVLGGDTTGEPLPGERADILEQTEALVTAATTG